MSVILGLVFFCVYVLDIFERFERQVQSGLTWFRDLGLRFFYLLIESGLIWVESRVFENLVDPCDKLLVTLV